jgi:hypothetical protein
MQENSPTTFVLCIVLGKIYVVGGSGAHEGLFRQKSDPDTQFGCRPQKLMHYSEQYSATLSHLPFDAT